MSRGPAILLRQVRHELVALWRNPITLILSVGFPLVFFVLVAALIGNEVVDERSGARLVQFLAPGFASFGVVMATFSFLAISFAEARTTGVLKRQGGTPLPTWALLGGRIGAALLLGLIATGLVLGVGVAFYDLQLFARTLPAVILTLVLSSITFSALGLALAVLLPTMQATIAVTNGIVIPLAFFSDIFVFGGDPPAWMSTVGWIFPLKHTVNLFGEALNPYATGSGFALDHLGAILAWGVAGAVLAAWALRREKDRVRAPAQGRARPSPAADAVPRRSASPSPLGLLGEQTRHTSSLLWRDASAVFFAVAFPAALVAIIPTLSADGQTTMPGGQSIGGFFAATMAVYGAAVTAYVNMPEGLAEARDQGVLKRTRGTPLPLWVLLGGRVAGAVGVALLTVVTLYVVAVLMYGITVPRTWPALLLTLVLTTVCFSALGVAVMCLVRTAQATVGLTLGTLLPLCFVSDVFVVGASFPSVVEALGWTFPLRHATAAMTTAAAEGAVGSGLAWDHLAVIAAWMVAGLVVVAWRFSWAPRESGQPASRPGAPAARARAAA